MVTAFYIMRDNSEWSCPAVKELGEPGEEGVGWVRFIVEHG